MDVAAASRRRCRHFWKFERLNGEKRRHFCWADRFSRVHACRAARTASAREGDGSEEDGDDDHPRRPLRSFCPRWGRDGRRLDGWAASFSGRSQQPGAAAAGWRGKSTQRRENRGNYRRPLLPLLPRKFRFPGEPRGDRWVIRRRRSPVRCWPGRPRGRPRWPA
jgi:hypothetical protein